MSLLQKGHFTSSRVNQCMQHSLHIFLSQHFNRSMVGLVSVHMGHSPSSCISSVFASTTFSVTVTGTLSRKSAGGGGGGTSILNPVGACCVGEGWGI